MKRDQTTEPWVCLSKIRHRQQFWDPMTQHRKTRTERWWSTSAPITLACTDVAACGGTLGWRGRVDCEPVIRYLHRGMEKIAENRTKRVVMFVPM